ncbi:hypothetical protein RhiirC2_716399, partial [Rhizophagus irregularis]
LGAEACIDFKRDADAEERNADSEAWRSIIEDISKAVTINYGKGIYSITSNNCEHRSGQFDGKFWKPSFWLYKELKSEADEFNYQNSFIRRNEKSRDQTRKVLPITDNSKIRILYKNNTKVTKPKF